MSRVPIYGDCDICGQRGEQVTMCGGYGANLCLNHRNDWHEYAFGVQTVRNYLRATGKLEFYRMVAKSAVGNIDEETWMKAQREAHELGKKAVGLCKRWLEKTQVAHLKAKKILEDLEEK